MTTETQIQTAAVLTVLEAKRARRALYAAAKRAEGKSTIASYRALANRIDSLLASRAERLSGLAPKFLKVEWQVSTRIPVNVWEAKAMRRALAQAVENADGKGTVQAYSTIYRKLDNLCTAKQVAVK